jgi:hypothetical protein
MGEFVVRRDDARDLKFSGERIAHFSTKSHQGPASNRWLELALYRTKGGKLVCQRIGRTIWEGERDRHEACVVSSVAEVVEFFGFGDAAKRLYDEARIDYTEQVE